jgi:hypothetical protein
LGVGGNAFALALLRSRREFRVGGSQTSRLVWSVRREAPSGLEPLYEALQASA